MAEIGGIALMGLPRPTIERIEDGCIVLRCGYRVPFLFLGILIFVDKPFDEAFAVVSIGD